MLIYNPKKTRKSAPNRKIKQRKAKIHTNKKDEESKYSE